jgi:glucan biosynthesis protein
MEGGWVVSGGVADVTSMFVGEKARRESQFLPFCHDRHFGIRFPVGAGVPLKRRYPLAKPRGVKPIRRCTLSPVKA